MTAVDVRPAVLNGTELLAAGRTYLMANPLLREEL